MLKTNFKVEIANTTEKYEGLRALWCEVFNDEADFVDAMYRNFGADPDAGVYESGEIKGYVITNEKSYVISALTCFYSGKFEGRNVYTSYAICTKADMRGLGLAGKLISYVKDAVLEQGGVSLVSPAEPSLEEFYSRHGYDPFFFALQNHALLDEEDFIFDEEDEEYEKFKPEFEMKALDAADYNKYREALLHGRPHVELCDSFMNLVYGESLQADGSSGLYSINRGDAICALAEHPSGFPVISELILNPVLAELSMEIDGEIARMIALRLGTDALLYSTPGPGACQSMAAGIEIKGFDFEDDADKEASDESDGLALDDADRLALDESDEAEDYQYNYYEAYYGFPIN